MPLLKSKAGKKLRNMMKTFHERRGGVTEDCGKINGEEIRVHWFIKNILLVFVAA